MKNKLLKLIMIFLFTGFGLNLAWSNGTEKGKKKESVSEISTETKRYLVSIGQRRNFGFKAGFKGINLEHETNSHAIENILNVNKKAFYYTAIYKKMLHHSKVKGFSAFYGIGGHYYYNNNEFEQTELAKKKGMEKEIGYSIFGLDFVAGLSYKLPGLPLKISADLKPGMDLIIRNKSNTRYFYKDLAGLTISYQL
jgi:hypothetical protein